MVFLSLADKPNLVPLELLGVAGSLVNQDLSLGLADAAFKAPLPLGGFVEGVVLALVFDALLILPPELLQLRIGVLR